MAEYTDGEKQVLNNLLEAMNGFSALERQHPEEVGEFARSINQLQNIMMSRFTQRHEESGMTPVMNGA